MDRRKFLKIAGIAGLAVPFAPNFAFSNVLTSPEENIPMPVYPMTLFYLRYDLDHPEMRTFAKYVEQLSPSHETNVGKEVENILAENDELGVVHITMDRVAIERNSYLANIKKTESRPDFYKWLCNPSDEINRFNSQYRS